MLPPRKPRAATRLDERPQASANRVGTHCEKGAKSTQLKDLEFNTIDFSTFSWGVCARHRVKKCIIDVLRSAQETSSARSCSMM